MYHFIPKYNDLSVILLCRLICFFLYVLVNIIACVIYIYIYNIFIHTCYNCIEQYIPINNNILRIIKHVMLNI